MPGATPKGACGRQLHWKTFSDYPQGRAGEQPAKHEFQPRRSSARTRSILRPMKGLVLPGKSSFQKMPGKLITPSANQHSRTHTARRGTCQVAPGQTKTATT